MQMIVQRIQNPGAWGCKCRFWEQLLVQWQRQHTGLHPATPAPPLRLSQMATCPVSLSPAAWMLVLMYLNDNKNKEWFYDPKFFFTFLVHFTHMTCSAHPVLSLSKSCGSYSFSFLHTPVTSSNKPPHQFGLVNLHSKEERLQRCDAALSSK